MNKLTRVVIVSTMFMVSLGAYSALMFFTPGGCRADNPNLIYLLERIGVAESEMYRFHYSLAYRNHRAWVSDENIDLGCNDVIAKEYLLKLLSQDVAMQAFEDDPHSKREENETVNVFIQYLTTEIVQGHFNQEVLSWVAYNVGAANMKIDTSLIFKVVSSGKTFRLDIDNHPLVENPDVIKMSLYSLAIVQADILFNQKFAAWLYENRVVGMIERLMVSMVDYRTSQALIAQYLMQCDKAISLMERYYYDEKEWARMVPAPSFALHEEWQRTLDVLSNAISGDNQNSSVYFVTNKCTAAVELSNKLRIVGEAYTVLKTSQLQDARMYVTYVDVAADGAITVGDYLEYAWLGRSFSMTTKNLGVSALSDKCGERSVAKNLVDRSLWSYGQE